MRRRPRHRRAGLVLALAPALVACNSGMQADREDRGDATDVVDTPISVTEPASRLTPFCQAMIDLNRELIDEPPPDAGARIVEVYLSVVDEVPAEIEADFRTVLARLQLGEPAVTAPTAAPYATDVVPDTVDVTNTTTPLPDEGYLPDDDPTTRLAEYVRFACTDAANNPGPPPTQPGAGEVQEP